MVMMNKLLAILQEKLENVLQIAKYRAEGWVSLTNAIEADGSPAEGINNKLVMCLVFLQSDASTGAFVKPIIGQGDAYPAGSPPLVLDAYFLLIANFTGMNYPAGLEMMSRAIACFQETPVFTRDDAPDLPADVDKMVVEFFSMDFAQASYLLTMTGLKCLPFALYRIRRLTFSGPAIHGVSQPVRGTDPAAGVSAP